MCSSEIVRLSAQLKAGAVVHKCEVEAGGLEFQVNMYA